ncbi:MAG: hypothetical protein LIO85_11085 [Rikenellaceae bacterium]|nr:hypothetical protein [Rikenellaceae bacterium]
MATGDGATKTGATKTGTTKTGAAKTGTTKTGATGKDSIRARIPGENSTEDGSAGAVEGATKTVATGDVCSTGAEYGPTDAGTTTDGGAVSADSDGQGAIGRDSVRDGPAGEWAGATGTTADGGNSSGAGAA